MPLPPPHSLARRLVTPRLSLEPSGYQHLEGLWRSIEASLPELRPWMAWAWDPRVEQTRAYIARAEKLWAAQVSDEWLFSIVLGGEPVGAVGLASGMQDLRRAELGYWLRSDLAGRGLMTEAASAIVTFAFNDLGLHRLELHAAPRNVASIRVAEKLGFRFEGVARDAGFAATEWQDMNVYGLLETDPRPAS